MASASERIRQLNDRFRAGDNLIPGHIMMTPGIAEITKRTDLLAPLLGSIQGFDGFDDGNDPYDEHDFGAVEFAGKRSSGRSTTMPRSAAWVRGPRRSQCNGQGTDHHAGRGILRWQSAFSPGPRRSKCSSGPPVHSPNAMATRSRQG